MSSLLNVPVIELVEQEINFREKRSNVKLAIPYFLKDNENPDKEIDLQDFQEEWFDWINSHKDWVGIQAPRGHGKTENIAIGYPVYRLGNNHELRIKIFSSTDPEARKRVASIKNYISDSEKVHDLYPDLKPHPNKDFWGKQAITVDRKSQSKDPSVEAYGIFSKSTGGRADIIILEDIVDIHNAIINPGEQEKIRSIIENAIEHILVPGGIIIAIVTRYTPTDWVSFQRKYFSQNWLVQKISKDLSKIESSTGRTFSLWNEKFSLEELLKRKGDMRSSRAFDRAYLDEVSNDIDNLFTSITRCIDRDKSVSDFKYKQTTIGIDLASSKRRGSAFTVLFVEGLTVDDIRIPIFIFRGRIGSIATVTWLYYLWLLYSPDEVFVETNAYQSQIIGWISLLKDIKNIEKLREHVKKDIPENDWLAMYSTLIKVIATSDDDPDMEYEKEKLAKKLEVKAYTTGREKADENLGLPALAALFDAGKWIIPLKDHALDCDCGTCAWKEEMLNYPDLKYKDTVMANWFAELAMDSLEKKENESEAQVYIC